MLIYIIKNIKKKKNQKNTNSNRVNQQKNVGQLKWSLQTF